MTKIVAVALAYICFSGNDLFAQSTKVSFKKVDETGDSSIRVIQTRNNNEYHYIITKGQKTIDFVTDTSFEYAFLAGASDETFVWLAPRTEPGRIICAFVSLTENVAYEIDLEKIVKNHQLIPTTLTRSNGKAFEFWNIDEWSNSEIGLSINCRLSPYDESKGLLIFSYKKKCVTFVGGVGLDLVEIDYPLGGEEVKTLIKKL